MIHIFYILVKALIITIESALWCLIEFLSIPFYFQLRQFGLLGFYSIILNFNNNLYPIFNNLKIVKVNYKGIVMKIVPITARPSIRKC